MAVLCAGGNSYMQREPEGSHLDSHAPRCTCSRSAAHAHGMRPHTHRPHNATAAAWCLPPPCRFSQRSRSRRHLWRWRACAAQHPRPHLQLLVAALRPAPRLQHALLLPCLLLPLLLLRRRQRPCLCGLCGCGLCGILPAVLQRPAGLRLDHGQQDCGGKGKKRLCQRQPEADGAARGDVVVWR